MGPAAAIIEKCGGAAKVAGWLGIDVSRVYRWPYPKTRGGSDGYIPAQYHQKILTNAVAAAVKLAPADFFPDHAEDCAKAHRESGAANHPRRSRRRA